MMRLLGIANGWSEAPQLWREHLFTRAFTLIRVEEGGIYFHHMLCLVGFVFFIRMGGSSEDLKTFAQQIRDRGKITQTSNEEKKFRVALLKSGQTFSVDSQIEHDRVQRSSVFVGWLTEWIAYEVEFREIEIPLKDN